MWKLSIEDDQGHRTVVNLVRDEYTIGRAQENTVRLTERNISRHHAIIRRNGSGWLVEDQASYNGCFVNGVRVSQHKGFEHGDLLQVGDYRLVVTNEAVTAGAGLSSSGPQPSRSQTLTGQPDRLVMLVGPQPGMDFPLLADRLTIGRGEECDICINHSSVSRMHAEITRVADGRYEIVDRESANGVRVNGAELQRALLDARDAIELGDIVLKFIPKGMVYRPGADESQKLGPGTGPDRGAAAAPNGGRGPSTLHYAVIAGVLGLALILGIALVSTSRREVENPIGAASQVDDLPRVLAEARSLLEQGQLESAHVRATSGIPDTSALRASPEFQEIEARWADALFAQAQQEPDVEHKSSLLRRIVEAPSVDPQRRTRAQNWLTDLTEGGVEVDELPRVPRPTPNIAPALPSALASDQPDAAPLPSSEQVAPATSAEPTPSTPKAQPRPAPARPDLMAGATSGDRNRQLEAIAGLKARVTAGTATERERRMLRALCRQHGFPECAQ